MTMDAIASALDRASARPKARFALAQRIDPWVLAALVAALAIRLFHLDAAPLWLDETETAIWSSLSMDQAYHTVFDRVAYGRYDPRHLPLYFVIVNAWTSLTGITPWLLRLPSVAFSLLTVGASAGIASMLFDKRTARCAAWLAALSPFLVHHGQEARMYALVAALAAVSIWLLLRYLSGRSQRLGIAFALTNLALVATHYYTVFLIAGALAALMLTRPLAWRDWALPAALSIVGAAVVSYVALVLTKQSSGEVYGFSLYAVPGVLWSLLAGYVFLPSAEELHSGHLGAVRPYLPWMLAGGLSAAALGVAGLSRLPKDKATIVGLILLAVLVGPFAVAAVFSKISLNPRYFTAAVPLLLAILAAGLVAATARRWLLVPAIALLCVLASANAMHLAEPGQKREDIPAAGSWIESHLSADTPLLVTSDEMVSLAQYHWPQRRVLPYPARNVVVDASQAPVVADALPFGGRERIGYVFGRSWLSDPQSALEQRVAACFASCGSASFRGIRVYCVMNRAPDALTPAARGTCKPAR